MTIPAPSPMTKPSRALSHGRLARVGSSLRVVIARAAQNDAMPSGHSAASVPPATITSAWPERMRTIASPIALAAVAHAVATADAGPRRPYLIDTFPLAALTISRGTVNGLTRPGPRSASVRADSSSVSIPPMPLPMSTPHRVGSADAKSMPESSTAPFAAAMAKSAKRSSRLASRLSMPCRVGSNAAHSPPMRVANPSVGQRVTGPMPLTPAQTFSHSADAVSPSDVMTPRPVMATLRCMGVVGGW